MFKTEPSGFEYNKLRTAERILKITVQIFMKSYRWFTDVRYSISEIMKVQILAAVLSDLSHKFLGNIVMF